jgi:hypothetical protein
MKDEREEPGAVFCLLPSAFFLPLAAVMPEF